jgi:hypothetical protein
MKKLLVCFGLACSQFLFAQTVTIPVVFHVVYKFANQNINDSCLLQQLAVLNEDYNKQNADTAYIPPVWQPLAANLGIHFALATVDPSGNPTTGIERFQTTTTSFNTNDYVKHTATGGLNAWPDSIYLNIWVCNLSGGLLGYSQYPGGPDATDGVVLHYGVTGLTCATAYAPFNKGRTGTFEVARWFGMRAMTGGGTMCTDNDTVYDTPSMQYDAVGTIAPFTVITDVCQPTAPGTMWMNFMTYADDASKYFFTNGQKDVAWYVLNNFRMGMLTTSVRNVIAQEKVILIYPSPTSGKLTVHFSAPVEKGTSISIHNTLGQLIATMPVEEQKTDIELDLSGNIAGMYFITINSQEQQITKRVLLEE